MKRIQGIKDSSDFLPTNWEKNRSLERYDLEY